MEQVSYNRIKHYIFDSINNYIVLGGRLGVYPVSPLVHLGVIIDAHTPADATFSFGCALPPARQLF